MTMRLDFIVSDNQYVMLLDVLGHADIDSRDSEEFNEVIEAIKDSARRIC